jgi:acetyl-CoA synthetase
VHNAIIGQYATGKYVLDFHDDDIYWCTADPGWVTGTSYGMFAPWSNGVTQVIYEGGFGANIWYDSSSVQGDRLVHGPDGDPHADEGRRGRCEEARSLQRCGSCACRSASRSTRRPWCGARRRRRHAVPRQLVADGDGGHHDRELPVDGDQTRLDGAPFPGIEPAIIDDEFNEVAPGEEGDLAVKPGWPSMFRTYWSDEEIYNSASRTAGTSPATAPAWTRTATSGSSAAR